jgi:hypothetical protein
MHSGKELIENMPHVATVSARAFIRPLEVWQQAGAAAAVVAFIGAKPIGVREALDRYPLLPPARETRNLQPGDESRRILCVERPQRPGLRRCLIWINECLPKGCLIRASALERAMPIKRPDYPDRADWRRQAWHLIAETSR